MKSVNYKVGVLKRKLKMGKGDFAPGTLIEKARLLNTNQPFHPKPSLSKKAVAILGLV